MMTLLSIHNMTEQILNYSHYLINYKSFELPNECNIIRILIKHLGISQNVWFIDPQSLLNKQEMQ